MNKNENKYLEQQRVKLKEVLKYLNSKGYMNKQICVLTDIAEPTLSKYLSGSIKVIPNDFLKALRKEFSINPDYIRLDSREMLDIKGIKYKNFEKVVEDWETIEKNNEKYLHLTMDRNFYDFLVELDEYRKSEEKGILSVEDEIGKLKEMYEGTPDLKEFVLIPRNNFINILKNSKEEKKCLDEVIDLMEYTDYVDE